MDHRGGHRRTRRPRRPGPGPGSRSARDVAARHLHRRRRHPRRLAGLRRNDGAGTTRGSADHADPDLQQSSALAGRDRSIPVGSVLIPIPDRDFDPTEVAVSWQVLTNHGHSVVFATESGAPATADDVMLTGRGLDIWSAVPLLGRAAFVGRFLRANRDARDAYANMVQSPEYQHPLRWTAATIDDVGALPLPGGQR